MINTLDNQENKIYSFMDQLADRQKKQQLDDKWHDSPIYKKRRLIKHKADARDCCFNNILGNAYISALPLNPQYKSAYGDQLRDDMSQFIADRCPQGIDFYIKEAIKNKSSVADKLNKGVNEIVNNAYSDMEQHPENYSDDEMVFQMDDDSQRKIGVLSRDLEMDDITSIINSNVKNSALAEILRAKKEKQAVRDLEDELANDPNVTSESAIDNMLAHKGFRKEVYKPSLFEGMMIGNLKKIEKGELSKGYTYGAMEDYGLFETADSPIEPSDQEIAFIEAVKELTKLNLVKAFKFEKFSGDMINNLPYYYMKG